MPRPLVYSNGSLLLGLDSRHTIRDLFFPQVGRWNHVGGHKIRMGVWIAGKFAWTDEEGWSYELRYDAGSLVGHCRLTNEKLGVDLKFEECVSHRANWFVRSIVLRNMRPEPIEARLFFSHDLRIMESDIGDTAFYNPYLDGIVHYKGSCYFLFGGKTDSEGLFQYATGLKGFRHYEGTWRDAEDGSLSNNPIAQGSVDSTLSLRLFLLAEEEKKCTYWIVAADDLEKLTESFRELQVTGCKAVLETTGDHWRIWAKGVHGRLAGLPERVLGLCEQSLLLVRTHIDQGGAIIAAVDSDIMETNRANYCYMWPRDGALISSVLDSAGQHRLPRAFFEFCYKILPADPPILRQKYTADGKLGATWHPWIENGKARIPFQEDETASMILAILRHHLAFEDLEALRLHFDHFVKPAAGFILEYRDLHSGLPLPSYDIWEERLGVHTYTVATVIAGLEAAADIARILSEPSESYEETAEQMRQGFMRMADPRSGVFCRRLISEGRALRPDWTVDASILGVGLLGVLPPDDPRVKASAAKVEEKLWVKGLGGVARYEGDYYFRRHENLPGNPWIICTCWLAQQKIMAAASPSDLNRPLELIQWCCDRAAPSGVLPEQVDAVTGEHLSVSPLTWSHAELVKTCFDYSTKLEATGKPT